MIYQIVRLLLAFQVIGFTVCLGYGFLMAGMEIAGDALLMLVKWGAR